MLLVKYRIYELSARAVISYGREQDGACFPLKCPSNYGNAIVIEGKRVSPLESKCVMLFFVYCGSTFELPSAQKSLA